MKHLAIIFNKTSPSTTGVYLERACRELGVPYDHWELQDIGRIPDTYALYLRIDHGDDYHVRLADHLRPMVFYAIDTHLPHSWRKIKREASRYDFVFCAHAKAAHELSNAKWLPLASDAELHRGVDDANEWDVAFVGNDGGVPRKFYLQALRERYPRSRIGTASYKDMAMIYGRSRVGFNYSIAHDINMRIFEVLMGRTLLVTNQLPGDDMRQLGLESGKHFVSYRTARELFEVIDYYLAHSKDRESIVQRGHAVVRERHTYLHRMRELFTCLSHEGYIDEGLWSEAADKPKIAE